MATGTKVQVQPGDLRKPLQILTRSDNTSATGGSDPTYVPLHSVVWAHDAHKTGKFIDQGGKLVTYLSHVYTVYFDTGIVAGMYIQDPDFSNKIYIQSVEDPDGTRHWMQLTGYDIEG